MAEISCEIYCICPIQCACSVILFHELLHKIIANHGHEIGIAHCTILSLWNENLLFFLRLNLGLILFSLTSFLRLLIFFGFFRFILDFFVVLHRWILLLLFLILFRFHLGWQFFFQFFLLVFLRFFVFFCFLILFLLSFERSK